MPFALVVVVLAVTLSYARGGRLTRIADAPLRSTWLLFAGLVLQTGVDVAVGRGWLPDAGSVGWSLLLVSQVLIVAWLVRNGNLPGVLLVALGLAMNAAVMAANGAMPVDPAAIRSLGLDPATSVPLGKHTLLTTDTRLPWLADIWPLPPLRTIISVGDVVIAGGLVPMTHALMTWQGPADRRGGTRRSQDAPTG